ncbi:MAG: hypothetical protein H6851_00660 [Geminicoccaceae bacterium]|nr:hypothetical protein [Geminicoccaceae bacterium]MCB9942118.1 hypothetical protein [Geminicoccaceae bacterium]
MRAMYSAFVMIAIIGIAAGWALNRTAPTTAEAWTAHESVRLGDAVEP